ncbi:MAG: hypothetical protein K0S53_2503 [Bacteroidetes bacterium]|jgi:hypothetical protein|nr:hypothetical protein [Bacteroidota bacterium]MDF2453376.1 hypothetical protein [Bacteroidota bacterium]
MFNKISAAMVVYVMTGCSPSSTEKTGELKQDTIVPQIVVEKERNDSIESAKLSLVKTNDTLNALANIMSGIADTSSIYQYVQNTADFKSFSKNFDKRWNTYDSTRLMNLRKFRENEISKVVKPQTTLFYPFSGPDILHAQAFFPEADQYILIGLEPVGSLPEFRKEESDSLDAYFSKVNTSLNAILKFSFFRTQSMKNDLKNEEVDGTLHLLFLFLKRTGNELCSAKPVTVDSSGSVTHVNSFEDLKKLKTNTRGVEIKFVDVEKQLKTLYYFSLNAADGGLKSNKGFVTYLKNMGTVNTYLKGASYLMHKNYFSMIRNVILDQSQHVVQDDSGIAFHYFQEDDQKWSYSFFGQYLKPIPMFSVFYQKDLDSLYKMQGSKPIGFGIGYNFKDKNSNFMIATKQP